MVTFLSNGYEYSVENDRIYNLTETIELNPDNAAAYNSRGNVYYALEQSDKVLEDWNKVVELEPKGYQNTINNIIST
jgi:tetratricopeptide (TPR) repeat protein